LGSLAAGLHTVLAPWYGLASMGWPMGHLGLALSALLGEFFLSMPPLFETLLMHEDMQVSREKL